MASIRTINLVGAGRRDPQARRSAIHHETQSALQRRPAALGRQARGDLRGACQRCPQSTSAASTRMRARLEALRERARLDRLRDGFLLPAAAGPQAAVDRLPRRGAAARRELLRPARLRGAPDQPVRHRQGRHPDRALVPARPADRRDRLQRRADVVVGLDVRVPDAAAGDEGAAGRHPQPDQPSDHPAADPVRPLEAASRGAFRKRPTTPATAR